eukprot:8242847-Pyramimonas_sp.AAC.1
MVFWLQLYTSRLQRGNDLLLRTQLYRAHRGQRRQVSEASRASAVSSTPLDSCGRLQHEATSA